MPTLTCVVVTPEKVTFEQEAASVVLPLFDGEIGILPGHSPLIGRLGFGEMRLRTDGRVVRYYVDGGFVQVVDNIVSVLTGRAIPADTIDEQMASEQLLQAARRPANSPELMEIRDRGVARARAQLRAARRAKP
jgi:F-type H+-transporting ATPase subunit epsilon